MIEDLRLDAPDGVDLTYEEARELKVALGAMMELPAWKFFVHFVHQRADARERELIQQCPNSVESMVNFARIRGGIDELRALAPMMAQVYSDVTESVYHAQDEAEFDFNTDNMEGPER